MKPFARSERVGGLLHEVLSDILKKEIRDPRLDMTTITAIKLSGDLKHAKVYFTTPGNPEARNRAIDGFKSAAGYLKKKLAGQLGLRYMPALEFYYDESLDYGAHIDQVLKSIKK
jgi:ribosome-binding factor A